MSVFDSGFVLGDGVWEGIRLHGGVLLFAKAHFRRLYQGAKAIDMDLGCTPAELEAMVYQTVDANGMRDHVHIRLMVTRGGGLSPPLPLSASLSLSASLTSRNCTWLLLTPHLYVNKHFKPIECNDHDLVSVLTWLPASKVCRYVAT